MGSIIIGNILGYDKYYPVLSQMHYIFAIAIAIIGVTIIRIIQSRFRWRLFTKFLILVFFAMGLSYYHTDLRIINYHSYTSFYLPQEGEYFGTVVSYPELVTIEMCIRDRLRVLLRTKQINLQSSYVVIRCALVILKMR